MTKALVILASLLCIGITYADSSLDSPELAKPVTLAVKGEALSDILSMMQEQTGVRLRAATDVADRKATILVDEQPLRDVMEGIATLLKFRWSDRAIGGKKGYELWEDEKTRREREDHWDAATKRAWQEVAGDFQRCLEYAAMSPAELDRLYAELKDRLNKGPDYKAMAELGLLIGFRAKPAVGATARLSRTFSQAAWDAIHSGMTLYYDSDSPEDPWKLPDDVTRDFLRVFARTTGEVRDTGLDAVTLELSAFRGDTSVSINGSVYARGATGDRSATGVSFSRRFLRDVLPPPENSLPHAPADSLLNRQFTCTLSEIEKEANLPTKPTGSAATASTGTSINLKVQGSISGQFADSAANPAANRSDILALLHGKLGVQIISDHFSEWSTWGAQDRTVEKLLIALGNVYDTRNVSPCGADWGWDGKFLYMRTKDIRTHDRDEVPNKLLRRWKAVFSDKGAFGFDDFAEMSLLSDAQKQGLGWNSVFLGLGNKIITGKQLRFYGMLTANQRRDLLAGGLGVAGLKPEQKTALMEALPSQRTSNKIPGDGSVVGIYKDGWRVDKPEKVPDAWSAEPVSVSLKVAQKTDLFYYEAQSNGSSTTSNVPASTFDEAWKKIREQHPEAKKDNLVLVSDMQYALVEKLANGKTTEQWFSIPTRKTYGEENSK